MKENRKRGGIRSEDDNLGDTTVESFGCLVSTFLELERKSAAGARAKAGEVVRYLSVMTCLLDDVENFLRQCLVGNGPCYFVTVSFSDSINV